MLIKIDNTALEKSFLILKDLREISAVPINNIKEYIESPGIVFLKKHLKEYGGMEFDDKFLLQLIDDVLKNPSITSNDSIFLRSMKHGYKLVEVIEREFRTIDINEIIEKAVDLVNLYLPEAFDENVQVYFLYGIRGTGIVLDNEIAIDICDEYLSKNGILDTDNLINILAHELHHIAVNKYIFKIQQNEKDMKKQRLIYFMGDLISEGVACYYLPSPYDKEGILNEKWNSNLKKTYFILNNVKGYIDRILSGTLIDLKEIWHLFDDNLEGYTAGYIMTKLIDQTFGKEKVLECIKDCFLFLEQYNQAVQKENLRLPIMQYK